MGFRFAKVTPSEDPGQTVSSPHVGSKQWSAPEVLEDGEMSKKADIFSFAMVMIEARHAWSIICRVWLTLVSYRHRHLPERPRSATSSLLWSWSP